MVELANTHKFDTHPFQPCIVIPSFPTLPFDVLCDIFLTSSVADLRRFTLVSRLWHEAAYGRLYSTLELRAGPGDKLSSETSFEKHAVFLANSLAVAREVKHLKVLAWTSFIQLQELRDILAALPNLRSLHIGAAVKALAPHHQSETCRNVLARPLLELARLSVSERLWGISAAITPHDFACLLRLFSKIDDIEVSGFGAASSCPRPPQPDSTPYEIRWGGHNEHSPKLAVRRLTVQSNVADDAFLRALCAIVDTTALRNVSDGSKKHQFLRLSARCARIRLDGLEDVMTGAFYRRDFLPRKDEEVKPLQLAHCRNLKVVHLGVRVMLSPASDGEDGNDSFLTFVGSNWNALVRTLSDASAALNEINLTLWLDRSHAPAGLLTAESVFAQLALLDWLALGRAVGALTSLERLRLIITMKDVFLASLLNKRPEERLVEVVMPALCAAEPALEGLVHVVVHPTFSIY